MEVGGEVCVWKGGGGVVLSPSLSTPINTNTYTHSNGIQTHTLRSTLTIGCLRTLQQLQQQQEVEEVDLVLLLKMIQTMT